MEVHRLEREFVYNGVNLPDTTPTMTRNRSERRTRICTQK
jgi:PRTRC genetic system protein C